MANNDDKICIHLGQSQFAFICKANLRLGCDTDRMCHCCFDVCHHFNLVPFCFIWFKIITFFAILSLQYENMKQFHRKCKIYMNNIYTNEWNVEIKRNIEKKRAKNWSKSMEITLSNIKQINLEIVNFNKVVFSHSCVDSVYDKSSLFPFFCSQVLITILFTFFSANATK